MAENSKQETSDGAASSNKKESVAMNFVVDPGFRRDYKTFASENDMSMVDLLKESFELYKKSKK